MANSALHAPILRWYAEHARDLPWRRQDASPWAVLVSEVMLQQTPVARVLPVHAQWLQRWPTPAGHAAAGAGDAVRAWGRLGYPRRALRLHAAAGLIVARHDGDVPSSYDALLALPGIGGYTAAAIASFAFGQRHAVLDTNVRRVQARAVAGRPGPAPSLTAAEQAMAEALLPDDPAVASRWAVAAMEVGALVCTARSPACERCPIAAVCAWRVAGWPADDGPPRRGQPFTGTDRQVRGLLLAVLREATGPVSRERLDRVWADPAQRERALAGLLADGLLVPATDDRLALPA